MASKVVPVGGTVGIMGGGQLGRMMALAARAMGLGTLIWDEVVKGPAHQAADDIIAAPFEDRSALAAFAARIDSATYEFENVNFETAQLLEQTVPVFPPPELLFTSQNRIREKDTARRWGLDTTRYGAVSSAGQAEAAAAELGTPGILKTTSGGYDGKGQFLVLSSAQALAGFQQLHAGEALIYEKRVDFAAEVSVVVARDQSGRTVTYPVTENHHHDGILDWSLVPARMSPESAAQAVGQACALAQGLQLVGVMALEFFVTAEGRVLFNEMAPRPHNSGHWTIEGAWPSQFTQHMRAVAGWPVAQPIHLSPTVMVNLVGDFFMDGLAKLPQVLELSGVQLHWYGKEVMRPGRKVGHLTIVADSPEHALQTARQAKIMLGGEWHDGA